MFQTSGEVIAIDTKETCLLCYGTCVKRDGEVIIKSESSLTGVKPLLRYLKVDTKQLFNCSPKIHKGIEIKREVDVLITLCSTCSSVTEEFDKVYKEYELLQFQLDKCLTSIHQSMKKGDDNPERVREFNEQMQLNKSSDRINPSIAASLRDLTFRKCSAKIQSTLPRVTVDDIKRDLDDDSLNDINQISHNSIKIEPIECQFNPDNTQLHVDIIKNENQECQSDQSFQVPENDPLEADHDVNEEYIDEGSQALLISLPTAPPSRVNRGCRPIRNRQKKYSTTLCTFCNRTDVLNLPDHIFNKHPEYSVFQRYGSTNNLSFADCKALSDQFFKDSFAKGDKFGGAKYNKKTAECLYCDKKITGKCGFRQHLIRQHLDLVVNADQRQIQSTKRGKGEKRCETTQSKIYSCRYCPYQSGIWGRRRNHEYDQHIVDMLIPHLDPGTCLVKCSQVVKTYCNNLLLINGRKCPICTRKMNKSSLRRHVYLWHFSDFVESVKDCLDQGQLSDEMMDGGNGKEEPQQPEGEGSMIMSSYDDAQMMEFGTENVKLEVMAEENVFIQLTEEDPAEPGDNLLGDRDPDDPLSIHLYSSNSPASEMTYASSSRSVRNSTKNPSTKQRSTKKPSTKGSHVRQEGAEICHFCSKVFANRHYRNRHHYMNHPDHVIFNQYSSKLSLSLAECKDLAEKFLDHARAQSVKGNIINCCYCDKTMGLRSGSLNAHMLSKHMDKVADLHPFISIKQLTVGLEKCDDCSKVFGSKGELNKHKLTHTINYSCQHCSYSNHYQGAVKFHELQKHIVEVVTPHMAPIPCPIRFAQGVKAYYKTLLKIGTNCRICHSQIGDKHLLQQHVVQKHFNVFSKELTNYLDQGEFSDDTDDGNESEEKDLSSEYNFCQFCSFISKQKFKTERHERYVHTADLVMLRLPPDACKIKCDQGMKAYRKKIKTMRARCPMCVSVYRKSGDLQRHILLHHFDEMAREVIDNMEGYLEGGDGRNDGEEMSEDEMANLSPVDEQLMELELDDVKLDLDAVKGETGLCDPLM